MNTSPIFTLLLALVWSPPTKISGPLAVKCLTSWSLPVQHQKADRLSYCSVMYLSSFAALGFTTTNVNDSVNSKVFNSLLKDKFCRLTVKCLFANVTSIVTISCGWFTVKADSLQVQNTVIMTFIH